MYQLLIRLLSPLLWLIILFETLKRQAGIPFFLQRLGLAYPPCVTLPPEKKRIWLHCASVGEVKAAEPLIRHLLKSTSLQPEIIVTTNTPTGKELLLSLFPKSVTHFYLPLDWPFAIHRFLSAAKPSELWVFETEIWPNLYRISAQKGIRIHIINGRLSQKTLTIPNWLKKAYQNSLQNVSQVLARSHQDAERFIMLGANPNTVQILGNIKYAQFEQTDHYPNPINIEYVLLASSHKDEELKIGQLWQNLKRSELLVIVPRHPKRSVSIQKQLNSLGIEYKVASLGDSITSETQVFLDDRLGKLMPLFEHAKLVIMGGSFVPKGGHNILEPAAYGKAIITGPDMSDFTSEMSILKELNGIKQCQDYQQLQTSLVELLDNPLARQQLGLGALQALKTQSSTLKNYLKALSVNQ